MNKNFFFYIISRVMIFEGLCYLLPMFIDHSKFYFICFFVTVSIGLILTRHGKFSKQRVELIDCALITVTIFPILALIGSIPFIWTESLNPIDAFLESMSDVTTTGLNLLDENAAYVLKLWQSVLMWLGGLVFLSLLTTFLPQISGKFGIDLAVKSRQTFSPMFGQMKFMAVRVCIIYFTLSLIFFILFLTTGLSVTDSIVMVSRSISTGGGDFFPAEGNLSAEFVSMLSMFASAVNILLIYNIVIRRDPRIIFRDSEIKTMLILILIVSIPIALHLSTNPEFEDNFMDLPRSLHDSLFHVISFVTTTGFKDYEVLSWNDFDWFLLLLLCWCGGCIGSVTGGMKIIRWLILFKITRLEITKTLHPRMVTSVRISGNAVPMKIVSMILAYFFLMMLIFFSCAVIFSLSSVKFSTAVGMSMSCLTTIGISPGLCTAENFLNLPVLLKIFSCFVLILGRVEIFAVMILFQSIHLHRKKVW